MLDADDDDDDVDDDVTTITQPPTKHPVHMLCSQNVAVSSFSLALAHALSPTLSLALSVFAILSPSAQNNENTACYIFFFIRRFAAQQIFKVAPAAPKENAPERERAAVERCIYSRAHGVPSFG